MDEFEGGIEEEMTGAPAKKAPPFAKQKSTLSPTKRGKKKTKKHAAKKKSKMKKPAKKMPFEF